MTAGVQHEWIRSLAIYFRFEKHFAVLGEYQRKTGASGGNARIAQTILRTLKQALWARPQQLVAADGVHVGLRGGADTWSRDANGTYDVGPLQFNTAYLAGLKRFGIAPRAVEGRTCYPWFLAAWRIHNQLVQNSGGFWTRVARYHSATPHYVETYRRQLLEYAPRWRAWLIAHYPTWSRHRGCMLLLRPLICSPVLPGPRARQSRPPLAEPRRLRDFRRSGAWDRRRPILLASLDLLMPRFRRLWWLG